MTTEVGMMKLFLAHYQRQNVRLFRRNVVDRHMQDMHTGRVNHVKAGIVGQCDIYGFVKGGRCFEVEVKNVKGRHSKEQFNWRYFCGEWDIPYIILRMAEGESEAQTCARWGLELDRFIA